MLRPFVKIHGGKRYLYQWIISHFPKNYTQLNYIEPYCGACSVFLNKDRSKFEILNDIDSGIVAIIESLRDDLTQFITQLKDSNYSENVFLHAKNRNTFENKFDHAVNEFIVRRMSRGGLKESFAWSSRLRGGRPGDLNAWHTIIDMLPKISDRLKGVAITNKKALDIIKIFGDDTNTLFYCDPPYVLKTRQSKNVYINEMTDEQHEELAQELHKVKGQVVLSGYPSELYDKLYSDWKFDSYQIVNHASQKKIKNYKVEGLWLNF